MEQLLARRDADGANFLDGNPKELLPGLHYFGNAGDAAVYGLNSSKGLFLIDAPGDGLDKLLAGRKPVAILLTSAGTEATKGLAAIVRDTGCKVVAPKAGLETVRRLCPTGTEILTEQDLEKKGWLDVRSIALAGIGVAPTAYQLRWAGKTVLFSGRIPVKLSAESMQQLLSEIRGGNRDSYLKSLDHLAPSKPDLWLPAIPIHGQNANLYDRDWTDVIEKNRELLSR